MRERQRLADFQHSLRGRLNAVAQGAQTTSYLAFESAGQAWVVPLAEAGEVISPGLIQPFPGTQTWFLGVTNLRGALIGVTDLAAFLGAPMTQMSMHSRLICIGHAHTLQCALLVERLLGLRQQDALTSQSSPTASPWVLSQWHESGTERVWQELDLATLITHRSFLEIAAS